MEGHRPGTDLITALRSQIDKVDQKLQKLIESCEDYKAKNDIIQSMPGIGNVVALSLISNMPELGYISKKEAAALTNYSQQENTRNPPSSPVYER